MKGKKRIMALLAGICLLTSGITVFADSVSYDITVNSTATNQDNLSKKVTRNNYDDNYFYVTPTYYNTNNASFWATSYQKNGTAYSDKVYVENGLNEMRDGKYKTTAPNGYYYYMKTDYGYSATGTVHSKGTYTP